jgi:hypothetical protein
VRGFVPRRGSRSKYAVRHDDVQLVQNAKDAAEQLRETFESDVAGPMAAASRELGASSSQPPAATAEQLQAPSSQLAAGSSQPEGILLV